MKFYYIYVLNRKKDNNFYTGYTKELKIFFDKNIKDMKTKKLLTMLLSFMIIINVIAQPEMIYVEGGEFMMGCTPEQNGDCFSSENPAHAVKVSDFNIGKYEVTQDEWEAVMGDNPANNSGCGDCPIEKVDWYSIIVFCNEQTKADAGLGASQRVYYKDSGLTDPWDIDDYNGNGDTDAGDVYWDESKNGYRLPTEAEWEFAARGGTSSGGYKYSGSDVLGDVAWYYDNSGYSSHSVGGKDPNELDIYDMSGNVKELVWDMYDTYEPQHQCYPEGGSGSNRVQRNCSYSNVAPACRVPNRSGYGPTLQYTDIGFRVAQN